LRSGDIPDETATLSQIAPKFDVLSRQITKFRLSVTQISDPDYKYESPSNMWPSLMTLGQATLGREKKL